MVSPVICPSGRGKVTYTAIRTEWFGVVIRQRAGFLGILHHGITNYTGSVPRVEASGIGEVDIRATKELLVPGVLSVRLASPTGCTFTDMLT